jgi:prepilin signal peptidase PulO-like enzyme (type II secretory pathway)
MDHKEGGSPMKQELRRIDPLRAANVGAIVYGLFMGVIAVICFPIFLLADFLAPSEGSGLRGPALAVLILVLYPVMGVVMGWISGFLMSAIYNGIIRWSGGLLLEFDSDSSSSGAPV